MISFAIAILLAAVAVLTTIMRKTYNLVPDFELRRQAQAGDDLAQILYRSVAYGPATQLLLWVVSLLATAASLVIMALVVPSFILFLYVVGLIGYVLIWLPRTDVSSAGLRCVVWSTPTFIWLLSHLFTVLENPARSVSERQADSHTGLYERDDVIKLLQRQKEQADNRLSETEIDQLLHAITYSHKKVSEIMKPRKKVRTVLLQEAIGPVLMDELHNSGAAFFPVCEQQDAEHIVGIAYMSDLMHVKGGGYIREVMRPEVFYVNEDFTVEQLLHAFLKTKQQVLVVINVFEEYVGLVTIGNTLRHIVGHDIVSDFINYDNRAAVATFKEMIQNSALTSQDADAHTNKTTAVQPKSHGRHTAENRQHVKQTEQPANNQDKKSGEAKKTTN